MLWCRWLRAKSKLQNTDNKMKNCKQCEKCKFKIFFHFMISPNHRKFSFVSLLIFLKLLPMTTAHVTPFDSVKLINENSTLLHPLTNGTHNMTSSTESEQVDLAKLPWWCNYSTGMQTFHFACSINSWSRIFSDLEENENESECHCEGSQLFKIPQNLPQITRLSIANAKFKVLREAGLRKYSSSLKDL